MKGDARSDRVLLVNELKKEFESTILQELFPGILHNFANPLNGIMGRSRLLQKRAHEHFSRNRDAGVSAGPASQGEEKIIRDIDLIAGETDRFFRLFNDVAGKLYRLQDQSLQRINMSRLIEDEISFLNFYLDFKHSVKKELNLDRNLPDISGVPAEYSLAVWAILRWSMERMNRSREKELVVTTGHDDSHVNVIFEDTGIDDLGRDASGSVRAQNSQGFSTDGFLLPTALSLLETNDAHVEHTGTGDRYRLSLRIPC
jgi:signal transduction histidine kinase